MSTTISPVALATMDAPPVLNNSVSSMKGDFMEVVRTGAAALTQQTDKASELLSAYAVGEDVAPHELVMAMEQAKLSMQLALEVRNKLVDAYQELTRLQI